MKVGYTSLKGFNQTAYLDDDDLQDGPMHGHHKHSDESVWVVWDEARGGWFEVTAP